MSRSTSRSASRSSAGVIRSNSRWRSTSPARVGIGGDDYALDLGLLGGVVVAGRGDRDALFVGARLRALVAGLRLGLAGGFVTLVLLARTLERRGRPVAGGAGCAGATSDRTPRRRCRGRHDAGRTRPPPPPGPARARPCRPASAPGRSRRPPPGRCGGRPPATLVRTRPPRSAAGVRRPRRPRAP